jgi:hypothetical protein
MERPWVYPVTDPLWIQPYGRNRRDLEAAHRAKDHCASGFHGEGEGHETGLGVDPFTRTS